MAVARVKAKVKAKAKARAKTAGHVPAAVVAVPEEAEKAVEAGAR